MMTDSIPVSPEIRLEAEIEKAATDPYAYLVRALAWEATNETGKSNAHRETNRYYNQLVVFVNRAANYKLWEVGKE